MAHRLNLLTRMQLDCNRKKGLVMTMRILLLPRVLGKILLKMTEKNVVRREFATLKDAKK